MTGSWIWRRLTHNFGWKLASLDPGRAALVRRGRRTGAGGHSIRPRALPQSSGHACCCSPTPPMRCAPSCAGLPENSRAPPSPTPLPQSIWPEWPSPGDQTFTLSAADFSLPQGVRFVRAVPSQVRLRFDRILSKAVPVELQLKGRPPAGYTLTAESVEPQTLRFRVRPPASARFAPPRPTRWIWSALTQTTEIQVNAFVTEARAQFESPPVVTVRLTIEKADNIP